MGTNLVAILETKPAIAHKSMFAPYFSPEAIRRAEPLVQDFVNIFMNKIHTAALLGSAVNLSQGFRCLTADIIMNYSFQRPLGALEAPGFEFPLLVNAIDSFAQTVQWRLYFPNAIAVVFHVAQLFPANIKAGLVKSLQLTQDCISVSKIAPARVRRAQPTDLKVSFVEIAS